MALLIHPFGALRRVTPANGQAWTLRELQAFVGGYIEQVRVRGCRRYMLLNEDGKYRSLPLNMRASTLLWNAGGRRHDVVVGTVVLVTHREMEGEE